VEHLVDFVVHGVAAGGFHAFFELLVFFEQGVHGVALGGAHGFGGFFELLVEAFEFGKGVAGFLAEGAGHVHVVVLVEVAGGGASGELDLAGLGFEWEVQRR